MLKVMRPALQKVIEKVIKDKVTELDAMAYSVKVEADRALEEAKQNPENAQNIYSRYATAAQNKLFKGKQKAQAAAADKKVNVAITQHDSIFPAIKLPGGISSKATEYKELAAKGEKWESPIFSIGSASKSSNIPTAGEVTRKDHSVTGGGVRGPQNIGNTESITQQNKDSSAIAAGQNGNYTNGSTTNGAATNGFGKQVDQAFAKTTNGTTLGANNPVFNGSAQVGH
jgi:hypothetical protein